MLMSTPSPGVPAGTEVVQIGPLGLNKLTRAQAVDLVRTAILLRRKADFAICNAHTALLAIDDPAYAETLGRMILLNDGIGVDIASRILTGSGFPANLNGTDFVPDLLASIGVPLRIYLLGARPASVEGTARHLSQTYPQHEVVGHRDGYFGEAERPAVIDAVNAARADLLLVAMGNPLQERFIADNRDRLAPTVCMGVGALFDFLSGEVVRAPKPVQAMGLEWLFRLLQEPRRLGRRYTVGVVRFLLEIRRQHRRQQGRLRSA
ncbi:WecB/TagA/CpsF family glycosyltransferase [Polymorphum gilvum]|uniref:Glycosyl transferase, WecB/TagA/CpsF family protein n=1 Tax=Polymorphum gilvum (strain LMG 25793 / CGMCC 1.9160 / SL003B-26A1) TaxID=991905 RepID=F2J5F9_POLGS|nr:WecB/TagA/CpsF family glycosyltransferase [Polymorphum gilvum]ADZ72329.1 Glycosyl transferase, WecB/TagA/CpsF family protein [Polymorphum gilvum SL003B-26A1]